MEKVVFVEGYNQGNQELDKLNELLSEDEWYVKSVSGVTRGEGFYPVFAFVLSDD